MAFQVEDFHDLVLLLEQRPDLRAQVRTLVLTDELLSLPHVIAQLAEAQQRSEARLDYLGEKVTQLTEAQQRTEARLDYLGEKVAELVQAQARTERRIEELAEAQQRTEKRLDYLGEKVTELTQAQLRTDGRIEELSQAQQRTEKRLHELGSDFRGYRLERKYRDNAPAFFGKILRRSRVVSKEDLDALLPEPGTTLNEAERDRLLATDLVVRGVEPVDRSEAYLVIEVSVLIELHDVARARDRAHLLSKATGKTTIAVVAGDRITDEAQQVAAGDQIWCVLDGTSTAPESPRSPS